MVKAKDLVIPGLLVAAGAFLLYGGQQAVSSLSNALSGFGLGGLGQIFGGGNNGGSTTPNQGSDNPPSSQNSSKPPFPFLPNSDNPLTNVGIGLGNIGIGLAGAGAGYGFARYAAPSLFQRIGSLLKPAASEATDFSGVGLGALGSVNVRQLPGGSFTFTDPSAQFFHVTSPLSQLPTVQGQGLASKVAAFNQSHQQGGFAVTSQVRRGSGVNPFA